MQKTSRRVLALVLAMVMALSVFSISASAANTDYRADYQSETHTVFKHTEETLAPGVEYYNNYAYSSDGKQMVYYVATADISRDDVVVQTSYLNQYKDKQPGMSKLSEQVAFANQYYTDSTNPLYLSDNYNVVAGTNASFYNMQTGQPTGVCYVDGTSFGNTSYPAFFAILKDAEGHQTAIMDDTANVGNYDNIWQAVGGQYWLVRDGEDVTADASGSYLTDRHSRTVVGITDDGKVVLMVLDGRQEPFSCGGTMHELAQIMIEAGCKYAMNIDGGGSTTFGARPEGEDSFRVINRPSDGSERSISSGLIIASMAAPSNVFDRVSMIAADEYVTPGTSTDISVAGVSTSGASADIPAEVTYEATNGTIVNGVFTAASTAGDAVITAKYNGNVVGTATVHVVVPDAIDISSDSVTVPYGKSAELPIVLKYGLNEVAFKASDLTFTLDDPATGTIDGLTFTAAEESEIASTVLTVSLNGTDLSDTATMLFGKGSEVIFDFEDGTTNGFNLSYSGYNYYLPRSKAFVATEENGKVHSGNYSLGLNIDYSNSQEAGYQMIAAYQGKVSGNATYYEGAQKLGAWLYIPDEYVGLWVRWTIAPISGITENEETGEKSYTLGTITPQTMDRTAGGTGVVYSFDESGWHYLYADLSQYKGLAWRDFYYVMQFYISDRDGASYGYYAKNQHNINGDFTVYLDDVTVDYSTVVEDRDAPVFSGVLLGDRGPHSNDAVTLTDGYVSDGYDQISLSARVADYSATNATGINASAVKAYIDGNEVSATYQSGMISIDEYTFAEGQHTVKFVAYDNQGNRSSATRTFSVTNVNKAEPVKVVPHDASLDRILHGSLYWVDVVAAQAEKVDTVTTTLNLDSMSKWELDHMTVADGFEASYKIVDAGDKIAEITIKNIGSNLAGEQALVSIPIRAWYLDNSNKRNPINNSTKEWTYAEFKATKEFWPVATEVRVQQGSVTYTDGSSDYFTGENVFVWSESWANYANMTATAEGKAYHDAWDGGHIHAAELTILKEAKAPTCTEDGWTAETFCPVCNSVVDWSKPVPATGHSYASENKYNFIINDGNGTQTVDVTLEAGKGYYFGEKVDGKYTVESYDLADAAANTVTFTNNKGFSAMNLYYWSENDNTVNNTWPGAAMTKTGTNDFGEDLYSFEIPVDAATARMKCSDCGILCNDVVDGKLYVDGIAAQGFVDGKYYIDGVAQSYDGVELIDDIYYEFDNGTLVGKYTGILFDEDAGVYRYSKMGEITVGWQMIDDNWHYFSSVTKAAAVGKLNFNKMTFEFDETGKLLHGEWVTDENGTRYYYGPAYYRASNKATIQFEEIDGVTYGFDTNGYRHESVTVAHISNETNKAYDFNADGSYIGLYTGLVDNKYYKDGELQFGAGLVLVDDDYYYIKADGAYYVGTFYVTEEKANGLMPPAAYEFADDGKMILKQGIIDGYYYRDNTIIKGVGLVEVDGDYYYIRMDGHYYSGKFYVTEAKSNGLGYVGEFEFGADGKMIIKEGVINGYYYENNSLVKGVGLVKSGDAYYYIKADGAVYVGKFYVTEAKSNGLGYVGEFEFGADGKMIIKEGVINGYYYENNSLVKGVGLVKSGDAYYYIKADGAVYVGKFYVTEAKSNGLGYVGEFEFGADGKMIIKEGVIDGYYYENNSLVKGVGLVKSGDAYYYIKANGAVYVGKFYVTEAKSNGLGYVGEFEFGADGKMIIKEGVINGYYYVNNSLVKGVGLVLSDGDYYYIKADGAVYVGKFYVTEAKSNGLGYVGEHVFGADGKMILE